MPTTAVTELLAALIRIDSTTGTPGEHAVLDLVGEWFAGQEATRVVRSGAAADGLLALPATASGSPEPHLVFACHADVVPTGDVSAWSTPPFEPTIDGGRIYGRGSSDMKSGLTSAMIATARLHAQGAPVALALSTGEELGSLGAPTLVDLVARESIEVGAVIVPESTRNEIVLGHRGALWLRIETLGVAAHGSTPAAGKNAVLAMRDVLGRIESLPLTSHTSLGAETVNVGTIAGGSVPNIVPDRCVALIDHRIVKAGSAQRILEWWRGQPEVADVSIELDLAPVWTDGEDPWVRSLTGGRAAGSASYFTDASVFTRSMPGVPMVVWGPGDPTVVHSVSESVSLDLVERSVVQFVGAGEEWATGRQSLP